ncbi:MAG: hypothetical protein MJ084_05690, partial [Saccharofermentans sp.]|nr:hypothetical protein [Saccharofermentans sp.]
MKHKAGATEDGKKRVFCCDFQKSATEVKRNCVALLHASRRVQQKMVEKRVFCCDFQNSATEVKRNCVVLLHASRRVQQKMV